MQSNDDEFKEIARIGSNYLARRRGVESKKYYIFYYDAEIGETRSASSRSADPDEARLNFAKWVVEHSEPQKQAPEGAQIATIVERYYLTHLSKLPSAVPGKYLSARIIEAFGEMNVSDLTSRKPVDKYIADRREAGLRDGSINKELTVLRAALNWAYDNEMLTERPPKVRQINSHDFRDPEQQAVIFTEQQLRDLLWHAESYQYMYRFILISLATGCRPCAAKDLSPRQIDLEHNLIRLLLPGRMQTKKRRPTVRLVPAFKPIIEKWMRGMDPKMPFVNIGGERVKNISPLWKRIVHDDLEMEGRVIFYSLRHTVATMLHAAGVDSGAISEQLGHLRSDVGHETHRYTRQEFVEKRPGYMKPTGDAINNIITSLMTPRADDRVVAFKKA